MKKTFMRALAMLLMLLMLASCASNNKQASGTVTTTDTTTDNGEEDESSVSLWVTHSYDKLMSNSKAWASDTNKYTVYMAKYESEGVHIALRSKEDTEALSIRVFSKDNEHITYDMFHVMPILKKGVNTYTDPCAPIDEKSEFHLKKDETMAILIDFTTSVDAPAGEYSYDIAIVDKNNKVYAVAEITVHVWDFEMPVEHKFQTACGNLELSNTYKASDYTYEEMHYEMLLEHNLSGYIVPGLYLNEVSDKWMSDPRVTSFRLPYGSMYIKLTEEEHKAIYDKIMSNPDWAKKAMFYPYDEPHTKEQLKEMAQVYEYVLENFPGIRTICPFYTNVQLTADMDQVDFMAQYMNIHCPKFAMWDDNYAYSPLQMQKYDSFEDRMKALQEKGDTVWAYVCNEPAPPYLNVHIDDDGLRSRVLFWQFYQRDIDGFLYYSSVASWSNDPWQNVERYGVYGDGLLLYPGDELGYDYLYPIPSIRLKIIRDGIDDIELMYIAEELLGREWVDNIVNQVSSSIISVDVTDDEFAALRIALGNAVEAELNK